MLFKGLLLYLFIVIIRPQDFMDAVKDMPIVFGVMMVLLTAWLLSNEDKKLIRNVQDKYYIIFFTMIVISTLSVGWLGYTFTILEETLKVALIYWFIISIVSSEQRFKTTIWAMIVLMTLVAGMGILQHFGYDITGVGMLWAEDKKLWQIRGAGLFNNPNDLAYSVSLVLPFALGFFLSTSDPLVKFTTLSMLIISGFCIYLTHSRGGYLAATMCIATWFYYWISRKDMRRLVLFAGIIVVIAAFSIQTKDYREDKSSMGRVEAWAAGMEMLQQHPFIGIGKGQFIEHHERDSHNSYVRAGAELGVIGLFAFIGILFSSFRSLQSEILPDPGSDMKIYRVGLISYLSSYAVGSIFSTRTYDIIFMIIIALAGVVSRISMDRISLDKPETEVSQVAESRDKILNQKVIGLTLLTIIIWKIFLIQTW
jgi:putative inorganic carbon (hco3(-)) transporter